MCKPKEIHNLLFIQGDSAFHVVACRYNFRESRRVRKEASERD